MFPFLLFLLLPPPSPPSLPRSCRIHCHCRCCCVFPLRYLLLLWLFVGIGAGVACRTHTFYGSLAGILFATTEEDDLLCLLLASPLCSLSAALVLSSFSSKSTAVVFLLLLVSVLFILSLSLPPFVFMCGQRSCVFVLFFLFSLSFPSLFVFVLCIACAFCLLPSREERRSHWYSIVK